MAENDGNVNIGVKFDTDKVSKEIDGLKGKISKITGSNILKSVTGLGAAFLTVKTAVAAANKVIGETSEAYRVQAKAEKQLEAAAKNNPYLDASSVKQLKDYASQLQSISTVGDESLIPLMAQLASSGRTQAEIQSIMSAALDVSASGMMSLESAVQQLNASYSGNIGMLGRQISELKNLDAEQLKNGAAVDLVAKKFKGMAQEVAEATGTSEQLKNAWGDLKEEIGAGFEKGLTPMRKFFTELISQWTNAAKARREYENAKEQNAAGTGTSATYNTELEGKKQELELAKQSRDEVQNLLNDEKLLAQKVQETHGYYSKAVAEQELERQNKRVKALELEVGYLEVAEEKQKKFEEAQKKTNEQRQKAAADAKAQADADAARAKYISDNETALNNEIEKIKLEAELKGESADAQDILNAYIQSYFDLINNGTLSANDPYSKERLKELKDYAASVNDLNIDISDLEEEINEFLGDGNGAGVKLSDEIEHTIELLAQQRNALDESSDAWKAYNDKIAELEKLKADVVAEEEEKAKQSAIDSAKEITDKISDYVGQFTDIATQITDIAAQANETNTNNELTKLSEQYTDGLISYEEYCDKKAEISKKSAQEEYRINLYNWRLSLLTAAANIAQGVASCLAETGIPTALKYVNMALVAASGAAQIATITANRPTAPAFANGGIVGGNSYSGDHITSRLNSGEMVLNSFQQAQLWKAANNGNGGGTTLNVDVINNMGDSAKVTSQLTARGLRLTVDKIVNAGLADGRYNNGLTANENNKNGVAYL